jgi:hypothetical protein
MMPIMKRRLLICVFLLLPVLSAPAISFGRPPKEEREIVDARLEGYDKNVSIEGGTALTWLMFIFLGAICMGVMFKNAKRTHLD